MCAARRVRTAPASRFNRDEIHDAVRAEIINTGTEILLGHVQDAHLAFVARRLAPLGVRISRLTTVPDGPDIAEALREAIGRCDLVFVTGGLGPTSDDLTRELTAELLGLPLEPASGVEQAIRERFALRGLEMAERNRRQAMVPRGATVLPNPNGTAPGLHLPPVARDGRSTPHIFLLPGPPRELCPMIDGPVLEILRSIVPDARPRSERVHSVAGLGESLVEDRVGAALGAIEGLEIGYCARPGEVDVRLIGERHVLERAEAALRGALGDHLYGGSGESIEEVTLTLLVGRGCTLALAESCTGGRLADRFTDVPGASAALLACYVTYANSAKIAALGVPSALLAEHGAVSEPAARAMAEGALLRAGSDYALASTGIAGPNGGTSDKPVGTVFVALAEAGRPTDVLREFFPGEREQFKRRVAQCAFDLLRRRLIGSFSL
jgi:nicotinamide-nucleotide amidase